MAQGRSSADAIKKDIALGPVFSEQTSLRFRNDFEYGEDWQFWMEASQLLRIVTLPEVTGVQNVRTNGTNTVGNEELQPEWISSFTWPWARAAPAAFSSPGRPST